MEENKLKLSQFLDIIKFQFDEIIWYHTYMIEAEVKSIKQNRQFFYIDLVEIENWKITDSVSWNIWRAKIIESFLLDVWIVDIQDLVWKKLLLTVKPTFHKIYKFKVEIQKIHSDFFIWWLELKKKENIKQLKRKWIFYNNEWKDIWYPTFNIAVITGKESEWYRDFKTILDESGYEYNLTVFNSLVHWEKASLEVFKQLQNINNKLDDWEKYNLVAIMRGGWWSEWMNWTNDFDLCNEVCDFKIPVMSAVWHTVDQSILDMVSCYDCKTPSEAAQILVYMYKEFNEELNTEYNYINNCITDYRDKYKMELKIISKNLPLQILNRIRVYRQRLESFNIDKKIKYHSKILSSKLESFNIDKKIKYHSKILKNNLEILYSNINSNNPDKILNKWYNLVYDSKWKVVKEYDIWNDYNMKGKWYEYLINIKEKLKI
jgi:exodeoxyribonuclease VII large subunit